MRLAARARCGFYPCPSEAIAHVMQRVERPTHPVAILDPCAGRGDAIGQIAVILDVAPALVHAIELDEGRSVEVRERLPDSPVLAPCSFFGASITPGTFSFAWVNPPFDDEIGGGDRTEREFLSQAMGLLKPGGVVALVCPERVIQQTYDLRNTIIQHFAYISVVEFPAEVRRFNEVVVFATKRLKAFNYWETSWAQEMAPAGYTYRLPESQGPKVFAKHQLTDLEVARALAKSLLRKVFLPPGPWQRPRPPMTITQGQTALLLASGHIDGPVCPPGETKHVVRGTARKETYVASTEEDTNEKGETKTTTVMAERIVLVVRAVWPDGEIKTYE